MKMMITNQDIYIYIYSHFFQTTNQLYCSAYQENVSVGWGPARAAPFNQWDLHWLIGVLSLLLLPRPRLKAPPINHDVRGGKKKLFKNVFFFSFFPSTTERNIYLSNLISLFAALLCVLPQSGTPCSFPETRNKPQKPKKKKGSRLAGDLSSSMSCWFSLMSLRTQLVGRLKMSADSHLLKRSSETKHPSPQQHHHHHLFFFFFPFACLSRDCSVWFI